MLARIDRLLAQIAARDDRIAELEAELGGPPKTPLVRLASQAFRHRCAAALFRLVPSAEVGDYG